jgi:hypothetical protein
MASLQATDTGHFLRINVHDSEGFELAVPAVALRIFSATTAHEVARMVAHKLKLSGSRNPDTSIIMVRTVRYDAATGAVRQVLHTLRDDERPVALQARAVKLYLESNASSIESSSSKAAEARPPPLQPDDIVRWYFRDNRSLPLDLEHDTSGSDESEDEDSSRSSPQDLAHLSEEGCTRCAGFLLKQSARDPNLWRKRFCILAGDKLWYMKKRPQRSRGQLSAASSLVLTSARVQESPPKVPFGFELQTLERVIHFRAFGRVAKKGQLQKVRPRLSSKTKLKLTPNVCALHLQVQRGWLQAIAGQIVLSDENALISMAELIVCDTEGSKARRAQRRIVSKLSLPPSPECSRARFVVGKRSRVERFVLACQHFREAAGGTAPLAEQWRGARALFEGFLQQGSSRLVEETLGASISEAMREVTAAREALGQAITDGAANPTYSPLSLFDSFYDDSVMSLGLNC